MDWLPLDPIAAPDKIAAVLNRQIADLAAFRDDAESPSPKPGRFYRGDEAVNEALRRELMLRIDIARYLQAKKKDAAGQTSAIASVRKTLDDREGHRP